MPPLKILLQGRLKILCATAKPWRSQVRNNLKIYKDEVTLEYDGPLIQYNWCFYKERDTDMYAGRKPC